MSQFSCKVVLITGASSGIGAATAKAFSKQGACLSITGRNKANLNAVAEECKTLGAKKVLQIIADLANNDDLERLVKETINELKQLDVLVNNAGIFFSSMVENFTAGEFDNIFNVNLKAPMLLTQLAIPHLEKTKELAKKSIRVNAVSPAAVETDLFRHIGLTAEQAHALWKEHDEFHPLEQRNIEPEEVADSILFLASDSAKMITGSILVVDGGRLLTRQ